MTFGDLKSRLDEHSLRTDAKYLANRAFFCNGGLRWLQRKILTSVGMQARWTNAGNVIAGLTSVLLPTDWRPSSETTLFSVNSGGTRIPIRRIPLEWMYEPFRDQDANATIDLRTPATRGTPKYFALRGRVLEFRPAASGSFTFELHGLGYFLDLSADADYNLLTIEAEDACLYAALRQTWLYFEDGGRVEFWGNMAKEAALDWASDRVHEESGERPLQMETPG